MTADNDDFAEPTLFSALITPHRSLGRAGFVMLMLTVGGINFAGAILFLAEGAWPILFFLALDVLLVFWAFRANYRSGRAYEQVHMTPSELMLRKVSPRGEVREWTLNPLWVRLDREGASEFGLERLSLVSRGRRVSIANFLNAAEKVSFADALAGALSEAKRGPTRTVIE
jgi:uncharacterized membrane protein